MNSLTLGATTIDLPDDLLWVDEFSWRAVEQTLRYTLTGALLVEAQTRQAGRPITLEDGTATRSVAMAIKAWAEMPAQEFSLVVRGEAARSVVFDHANGPLEVTPWPAGVTDPADGDLCVVRLRFIEV